LTFVLDFIAERISRRLDQAIKQRLEYLLALRIRRDQIKLTDHIDHVQNTLEHLLAVVRMADRREPKVIKRVNHELFDGIFITDAAQNLDRDLGQMGKIRLTDANVTKDLDDPLSDAHAHV